MSDLSRKIEWAVDKFNCQITEATAKGKSLLAAAEENIGLLFYVRKIYPKGRFPAWARAQLSAEATQAVAEFEAKHKREVT